MSRTDLQKRLTARLAGLSEERLRVADDFLAYLAEIESAEATDELLRMPGIKNEIQAAKEEAADGNLASLDDIAWKE